LNFIYSELRK